MDIQILIFPHFWLQNSLRMIFWSVILMNWFSVWIQMNILWHLELIRRMMNTLFIFWSMGYQGLNKNPLILTIQFSLVWLCLIFIIGFRLAPSSGQLLLLLEIPKHNIAVLPLLLCWLVGLLLEESVRLIICKGYVSSILILFHFLKLLFQSLRVISSAFSTLVILWKL